MPATQVPVEPADSWMTVRDRRWGRVRLALVGLWLFVTAAFLVTYERPTGLDDLYRAVEAGQVDSVQIAGPVWDSGEGYVVQEVGWSDGLVRGPHGQWR